MKRKKVFLMVLLVFTVITQQVKADFWSKLRDAFIGGNSYSSSSSSSKDENIVDGKVINPKDKREYRLVEKMNDEKAYSESLYRSFESSTSKTFYYECTINSRDFLSIIGFRTFYGYAYEKRENEYKRKVSGRKIYLDDKLAKYIWKNEINVQKIAVYDARLNNKGYPLFSSANPRIFINDRQVSY